MATKCVMRLSGFVKCLTTFWIIPTHVQINYQYISTKILSMTNDVITDNNTIVSRAENHHNIIITERSRDTED